MSTAAKQSHQTSHFKQSGNSVVCRKCKSTQVVANKRGYSFGLMFKVLLSIIGIGIVLGIVFVLLGSRYIGMPAVIVLFTFFSLPISLLCGFIGRRDIENGCMNCGNKWMAGKQ